MALSETGILTDEELQKIYVWIDSIPLSRPKRNIARDFSDGVLLAEVVHHYFPKYVELHNYSAANSVRQKLYNWSTLNQKVFRRLDYEVKKADVEAIVNCKPGIIELILMQVQQKITDLRARKAAGELSPSAAPPSASSLSGGGAASALGPAPVARTLHMGGSGVGGAGASVSAEATVSGRSVSAAGGAGAVGGGGMPAGGFGGPGSAMGFSGPAGHGYGGPGGAMGGPAGGSAVDAAVLAEKDATIGELRETIEIQELKIKKLEQLVKLKDQRIQTLTARLQGIPGAGVGVPAGPPGY